MLSSLSGMTVSSRALIMLADVLRRNRVECGLGGAGWIPGRQALLVVSYLRKGAAYAELGQGFGIDTTTVYRYLREALELEAAMAPTLAEAIQIARGRAYVILDGMLRIDRVAMTGGQDRAAPMPWREPGSGDLGPRPPTRRPSTPHTPRQRGPGERANATLKNWKILRKIRTSPNRATTLVNTVQTLILAN